MRLRTAKRCELSKAVRHRKRLRRFPRKPGMRYLKKQKFRWSVSVILSSGNKISVFKSYEKYKEVVNKMLNSKDFIKARQKFVLVSIAAALLLFTDGFSGEAFGQDSLRESVYGKSKNHVAPPSKSGPTKNPPKPVKKKSNLRVKTFTTSSKKAEP